jgi:prepilin-type N-terminal cleavage/methylation domain-containing protein
MNKSQGFTLIELIAVIAILAILAATAIPQFVDLSAQARSAATSGVAGAISSAASMNYAKKVATGSGSAVTNCTDLTSANGFVQGVTVTTGAPVANSKSYYLQAGALTAGVAGSCSLQDDSGVSVTFAAVGS